MPLKLTTFRLKTLDKEGHCKSRFEIDQFSIMPNFQKWLKKRCKFVKNVWVRFEGSESTMPCFLVQRGYVLVDNLHLLVRGNPGPILRAVGSKSDRRCAPCRRAPFSGPFCFHGGKKMEMKPDFLLNSASVLPTLCVKASAQKASRAKVQNCNKKKAFFKVCTAGFELATARPKRMQALCLPL
jgi:hypothetical protein